MTNSGMCLRGPFDARTITSVHPSFQVLVTPPAVATPSWELEEIIIQGEYAFMFASQPPHWTWREIDASPGNNHQQ